MHRGDSYNFLFQPQEDNFALFHAIQDHDLNKVKEIVNKNPKIINDINNIREPLSFAIHLLYNDISIFLIENGSNLTPSNGTDLIYLAIEVNNLEMILYLEKYIQPTPFLELGLTYIDAFNSKTSLEVFKHVMTYYNSSLYILNNTITSNTNEY